MLIDNFAKLNRSSRNAASASLVVIAAIAVYNQMVAPQVNYLLASQRYESAVGDIVNKNRAVDNVNRGKGRKLEELREQFGRLQRELFVPEKAKEFFGDLQVISEQAGCKVYSLNFVEDKRHKDTSIIVAKNAILSVVGGYGSIIRLVETLQSRSQKVWIDSLKIKSLNEGSAQLRCDITVTIYTIQDEEATVHE